MKTPIHCAVCGSHRRLVAYRAQSLTRTMPNFVTATLAVVILAWQADVCCCNMLAGSFLRHVLSHPDGQALNYIQLATLINKKIKGATTNPDSVKWYCHKNCLK